MFLSDPVTALKGVGEIRAHQLECLGIQTVQDLICYFPRTYEDRTKLLPLHLLEIGEPACFKAMVLSTPKTSYVNRKLIYTKCTVSDDTAKIRITWFNQPWMSDNLKAGNYYYFYGTLTGDERRYEISNPVVEKENAPPRLTRCIIPVYSLTKGLTSKMLQQLIGQALDACENALEEILPQDLIDKYNFPCIAEAYRQVHWPTDPKELQQARQRLVFEEFFLYSMGLSMMKQRHNNTSLFSCKAPVPRSFFDTLPFPLTAAQQRTMEEISRDMESGNTMNRLVQGDVGSGKTMIALAAMLQTVNNGYQAALMAPTELLATQHYHTIFNFIAPMGINCVLLTGSTPAKERRKILMDMADGSANIIIGTHALFSDTSIFHNLGLVVIDEQHRFGVRQRAKLASKSTAPHILVLSATPIPRTLALIIYGDLDVSVIDELPPGRKTVDTFLVSDSYRPRLNGFIRKQVNQDSQVYVVCPAVNDNEETTLTSAESMHKQLSMTFPDLQVGLIHGKMKPDEKDVIMNQFIRGEIHILVATTVIEVGVDVPNATLMIIEDADRFGLSQIHQLRGRVGRGSEKSYCVLVSNNKSQETRKRLKALCATNDGFKISQQDLDLRGPGDFFGQRQSGLPNFHMASLVNDLAVLKEAQDAADEFLTGKSFENDPTLIPLLKRIKALFDSAEDTFN